MPARYRRRDANGIVNEQSGTAASRTIPPGTGLIFEGREQTPEFPILSIVNGMTYTSKTAAILYLLTVATTGHAQLVDSDDEPGPLDQVVPVAEDIAEGQSETDTEPLDDDLTEEQRLFDEFARYRRLIDEGALDEADTSAKRIVEMAIRVYGPQSHETAKALNNLAIVQHKNRQYEAAIQNFESSIEIIEDIEDRLNNQLVNPLKGLGASQLGNGRPDLAVQSFNRATHITHVNEGPHNIEQVEILESLAESTLRVGDVKSARDILDRIHVLNVRHFENNELGLLPSLMRRADWQHRAGYYNDERATYRRAIRIVEAKLGKNDPQLILPLRKLGESFYFIDLNQSSPQQQGLVATGEIYFKRAVRIAEANPDLHWTEFVDTNLDLADYYIYVDSHNRARRIYKEMWGMLSGDDERLTARADLLERPIAITESSLPTHVSGAAGSKSNDELLQGTIRVDYTVSERGRVRNLRTEAIPPEFTDMQRMVHREIRRRVFRPLMTDGELAETQNQVFEHKFFYRKSDLDALIQRSQPAPAKQASEDEDDTAT